MAKFKPDTLLVHAGQQPDTSTGSRAVPIYQTTSYNFTDAEHAAKLFSLEESGNIYTRMMNPTNDVLEKRVAALEGGIGALATASGQAAITYAIFNIAHAGDEIISASSLYGGTYNLFNYTFPKMGLKVHFVDPFNLDDFKNAVTDRTKAIYIETIGNPQLNVPDIEQLAAVAHNAGLPLIVDNTFAAYLCCPIQFGADIIVHSATKFIGGHGTSLGGVIVDAGTFNWDNGKYPGLTEPDPSYHGFNYRDQAGGMAYIIKARVQLLRDLGSCLSPFNAFLLLQGLETLHLRMQRHSSNALQVAKYLQKHPAVSWVNYPPFTDPQNTAKYLPKGAGAIVAFGVKGGFAAGKKLINAVQLFSLVANVGDAKSLILHPASTTHQQLTSSQREAAGVRDDMIRLSVGIEDSEDIIDDLDQALSASQHP